MTRSWSSRFKSLTTRYTFIFRHFDRNKKNILKIDVLNYVNENMLFQYDNNDVLYLVIFFNKNMISIECNYEIYDKKLFIIIRCLEH